ncbi:MAG: hypothetical protein U0930_21250, partial [Pirellulales bacterium]
MSTSNSNGFTANPDDSGIPAYLLQRISSELAKDSNVSAYAILDINQNRQFETTVIALAGDRLIEQQGDSPARSWPIVGETALRSSVFSGLGSLILLVDNKPIANWSFTAAKAADVSRLMVLVNQIAKRTDEVNKNH